MTASAAPRSEYRADVDGLRAVAVIPVVLFHAGLDLFSGGFVGVDVFFVISGFLITTLIFSESRAGTFSLIGFYERRVRRIFPALFAMLLVTSALAAVLSPPDVLTRFGKAVASSAVFSSNIMFWTEEGYFNDAMHRNPILHTWSLSVEEQFYIVYPLLLAALLKSSAGRARLVIGALCGASLALAVWTTSSAPSFAFYLMPPRAWELLLGGLLALGAVPKLPSRALREFCAALGMLLIAWSVFTYSPSTLFPGLAALVPCVGAALIIHASGARPTLVGRMLAWRPVVFVGLISYPLYLWHWPIIVFAKEMLGEHLRYREIAVCVLLSLALATVSWLLLERPIRRGLVLPSLRGVVTAASICLIGAAAVGGGLMLSDGMVWRYPPAARSILAAGGEGGGELFRTGTCFITPEDPRFDAETCLRIDPAKPNILLIGDSHAAHLWYGLNRSFPHANTLQATASGCRPVLGGSVQGKDVCRPLMHTVVMDFLPSHPVNTVIVAANWWNDETDLPLLPQTVACLERYADRVVVVGPINGYDRPLPELLAEDIRTSTSRTDGHQMKDMGPLDERMRDLTREHGIQYASLYRLLCAKGSCRKYTGSGELIQFDKDHLTAAGSVFVAEAWRREGILLGPDGARTRRAATEPCRPKAAPR